jgi:hypothetical protein
MFVGFFILIMCCPLGSNWVSKMIVVHQAELAVARSNFYFNKRLKAQSSIRYPINPVGFCFLVLNLI